MLPSPLREALGIFIRSPELAGRFIAAGARASLQTPFPGQVKRR